MQQLPTCRAIAHAQVVVAVADAAAAVGALLPGLLGLAVRLVAGALPHVLPAPVAQRACAHALAPLAGRRLLPAALRGCCACAGHLLPLLRRRAGCAPRRRCGAASRIPRAAARRPSPFPGPCRAPARLQAGDELAQAGDRLCQPRQAVTPPVGGLGAGRRPLRAEMWAS
jgi:hypothetical protein